MGRRRNAAVAVLLLPALINAVMAAPPAFACSCAEATLEDVVGREPGVAVGVVRRIDRDGGVTGVGQVVETLHGTLPDQVPLHLDDGGSCRPYLGVGQVAALSFQRVGTTWQTLECGMLDTGTAFAAAFGAVTPDPAARGAPAVVVAGDLPGADVVALDRHLAVLATANIRGAGEVTACGKNVLVSATRGRWTRLSLHALPDLTELASRRLDEAHSRVLDVRCAPNGDVVAVTRAEGQQIRLLAYADVFDGPSRPLPVAEDAAITGREILLLSSTPDARHSALSSYDLRTGDTRVRRSFDELALYSLEASPDGAHLALRGYGEESVLLMLDTASMAIVGRATGAWMPPDSDAWVGNDLLLLSDENRGMTDPAAAVRLVDARLTEVRRVGPLSPARLVGGRGAVIGVGSAELAVAGPNGRVHTSPELRLAGAWDAVALRRVAGGAAGGAGEVALPQPSIAEPPAGGLVLPAVAAIAAVAAALAALLRRRRRKPSAVDTGSYR